MILRAKGIPVLAHPFTCENPEKFISELKAAGLMGLEVYYGSYTPEQVQELLRLAKIYDLIPTGGSDFHGLDTLNEPPLGTVEVPLESAERLIAWLQIKDKLEMKHPEVLEFGLLLVAAYLVGSIPMAYLVVKWRYGEDIRQYGSGQVGASNVFRSFSKPLGVLVFIYDVGKGVLMVWIAHGLGMGLALQVAIGLAVIVGHNWPVFLHFNAGRGLATTIGVAFYLLPWGLWRFSCRRRIHPCY